METTSHLSPTSTLDTMASSEPANFLKLEDLHASSSPPATSPLDNSRSTPAPVVVQSKPAKKRKSWGQELPEPKTTLPPRKRAKTDDEKEQRRIERIKRNRAAAHNSRERKRQETETLAVALARVQAELDAYRKLHGPLPSHVQLPEVTLSAENADTPAPSLVESRGSVDLATSPASPEDSLFDSNPMIKEEPSENSFPTTMPPAFEMPDNKPALPNLDLTQHSAAMLCDLQCRSRQTGSSSNNPTWWTTLFLYIMTLQLQTYYKTLLITIWSLSPSRMARLMQASTHRLTSRSTTGSMTPLLLSQSTVALAQRNAATRPVDAAQGATARRTSMIEGQGTQAAAAGHHQHQQRVMSDLEEALEEHRTNGIGDLEDDDDGAWS